MNTTHTHTTIDPDTPTISIDPMEDRVVVSRSAPESDIGGIVVPKSSQEKQQEGLVLAVGPGRQLDDGSFSKIGLSVGDTIIFAKFGGMDINIDNQDVTIIRSSDVLAKVRK